jgi:hypothetical protein
MSDYMGFTEHPSPSGKTQVVSITSRSSGRLLGEIRWYGRWRQYCFFPESKMIFNRGCMQDIIDYIDTLKEIRDATR